MYNNILHPTDGSAAAENAVEEALDLATSYRATLHVLHVVDITAPRLNVRASDGALDRLEAEGEVIVEDVIEMARRAGVEHVTGSVLRAVPYQGILDYAEDNDIDLIVMGTNGRSGLERHLIGSVAENVVRQAEASVLTVRISNTD